MRNGKLLGAVWIAVVAVVAAAAPAPARQAVRVAESDRVDAPRATARPLAEALGRDGTLAPSAYGAFDATGWRLAPAAGGAPRFERAPSADDDSWRDVFSSPGTDDIIRAVAVRGAEVFVGGQFATIGKAAVDNVARWDGSHWTSLGEGDENGVDGPVYGFGVTADAVYVGGNFKHAGTTAASNVARWDGARWTSLGEGDENGVGGFGQIVYAIAVDGENVYVGGLFAKAGGAPAASLAVYDQAAGTWSEFGGVRNDDPEDPAYVFAIALTKRDVVVGGKFTSVGGVAANYVARYARKTGTWLPLGAGTDNWVTALAVKGKTVYAGGFFAKAGGVDAYGVARWDGASWSAMGEGLATAGYEPGSGFRVKGLALYKARLYVAGYFSHAGGAEVDSVAEWRGGAWRSLDGGLKSGVRVPTLGDAFGLAAGAGGIYVAGAFNRAGEARAFEVARWSPKGAAWSTVADAGPHEGVYTGLLGAVAVRGDEVYVGGTEMIVGGGVAYGVARWDGASWSTLGEGETNGVDGYVNAIAVTEAGDVIVGGLFNHAGGATAVNVARWDGASWSDLGVGVGGSADSQVFSVATDGGDVYVAGIFPYAGDPAVEVDNIAKWDGSAWSALGGGVPAGPVLAIAARGGVVYAGGQFTEAGGVAANNVARWDGSAWSALGSGTANGVDGQVLALAVDDAGRVVAGGAFATAGGASAANLALWDGASWSELGGGVAAPEGEFGYVASVTVDFSGRVVVAGLFATAGGTPANNVAVWGGSSWSTLGSGTNGLVLGAAARGGSIFLAGGFSRAGGKPSLRFAEWAGISI